MIAQRLAGERLHLQHGPIDVVLRAWGSAQEVQAAERAASARFATILQELVAELPDLRRAIDDRGLLHGPVARRMHAACIPFARSGAWLTPMAAVAGAVADELLAAMRIAAPAMTKAFVNDGGDVALFVSPEEVLTLGMVGHDPSGTIPTFDATLTVGHADGIGGIATSGRHGRSMSLGIADAVTVLARDAATADAAATLIANAVTLDSPAVSRAPACSLDPDSDLGDRLVTTEVGQLAADEIAHALTAGLICAASFVGNGLIRAAALRLAGQFRLTGRPILQVRAA
ncbi:UPF0280 family protein [Roseomonas sp. AR75]|uniref:UPF0280 family protein n=1 Tax=Roseomonas sp. AR75 TaxID=2562311 RepID=UPI0010BFDBB2|nr:UPF0280 family protein [Roseomonas sp. AR75]